MMHQGTIRLEDFEAPEFARPVGVAAEYSTGDLENLIIMLRERYKLDPSAMEPSQKGKIKAAWPPKDELFKFMGAVLHGDKWMNVGDEKVKTPAFKSNMGKILKHAFPGDHNKRRRMGPRIEPSTAKYPVVLREHFGIDELLRA